MMMCQRIPVHKSNHTENQVTNSVCEPVDPNLTPPPVTCDPVLIPET